MPGRCEITRFGHSASPGLFLLLTASVLALQPPRPSHRRPTSQRSDHHARPVAGAGSRLRGNGDVRTPNLDRLASQGVLFRNAFANTPVCCPARAIMLTGTYAHKNGMIANDLRLRESETTIAEILAAVGYRTGLHRQVAPRRRQATRPASSRPALDGRASATGRPASASHNHFRPTYFRDTDEPDHRKSIRARGLDRPGDRVPQPRRATIRSSWSSRWGRRTIPTARPRST